MQDPWKQFEQDGIRPHHDWSSLIFIKVFEDGNFPTEDHDVQPIGYILVIEPERHNARLKFAGGHKQNGEHPLDTAYREMLGETGLLAPKDAMRYVGCEWRSRPAGHWSCLCIAHIAMSEVPWMNSEHYENEGEIPKFLKPEQFMDALQKGEILSAHKRRLVVNGLVTIPVTS